VAEEGEEAGEASQPACSTYEELLDTNRHNCPVPLSLQFLLDLNAEIDRSWKIPYSARIHLCHHDSYVNVRGMREHKYVFMPSIEETLASYLSVA